MTRILALLIDARELPEGFTAGQSVTVEPSGDDLWLIYSQVSGHPMVAMETAEVKQRTRPFRTPNGKPKVVET